MKSSVPKKFAAFAALTVVVLSAIVMPMIAVPLVAYAQPGTADQQGGAGAVGAAITGTQTGSQGQQQQQADAAQALAKQNESQKENKLDCGANVFCGMVQLIGALFTFVTNLVATVAGLIADFSLWYSIQSGSYGLINPFLEAGWKLIRDFTYILFIFATLVLGFNLILNVNTSAEKGYTGFGMEPKRTAAFIIIMALLVSFSFFFSRTIIEVGNVIATAVYSRITTSEADMNQANTNATNINQQKGGQDNSAQLGSPSTFFEDNSFMGMKSVSLGILNKVNPQQLILNTAQVEAKGWVWKSYDMSFYIVYLFISICVAVFNLVLIYIFVSMALLFIGRYIGLAFAIILSPIAFVSVIVPGLADKEYIGFQDWISELVGLTFVAPVYMVFVYLTILFLNTNSLFGGKVDGYLLAAAIIMIKLVLTAMVLLRGKAVATMMAGHVGKMVSGIAGAAAGMAVGGAVGLTGFVGRQTLGRAGMAVATNGSLQRVAQSGPSTSIQAAQDRLATGIRNFGVGKYRLGNTQMGGRLANRVKNSSLANVPASSAQGLRQFGKNMYSVNPLDRSIGGISARRAAGTLMGIGTGNFSTDKNGKKTFVADNTMNQVLAKDYVAGLQKKQARDRMMDIEANKNAKKTLTNVIDNAFTSGLNGMGTGNATQPTTNTNPNPTTPSQPTNQNPQPQNTTPPPNTPPNNPPGGGGSTPVRPPNNNNSGGGAVPPITAPLAQNTPRPAPTQNPVPQTPTRPQASPEPERTQYDIARRFENTGPATIQDLRVENLTVKSLNSELPQTGSAGRAATLLSGIQGAPNDQVSVPNLPYSGSMMSQMRQQPRPVETPTESFASGMAQVDQSAMIDHPLGSNEESSFGGITLPNQEEE